MRNRAPILLVLAVVLGGITAYMVKATLSQQMAANEEEARQTETTSVVVAAADLDVGTELERVHLKVVEFPSHVSPQNSFRSVEDVLREEHAVVLTAMDANEVILPSRLSTGIERTGLTTRIPNGKRAVSIPVNEVRGVGGFVLPGDLVDVIHTTTVGRADEQPVARTLLQKLTVLGVDQNSDETGDDPVVSKVVTLLANPDEAKTLTLAQQVGTLTLALRNEGDSLEDDTATVALADLWHYEPNDFSPQPTQVTRETVRPRTIQVIRGLDVSKEDTGAVDEEALVDASASN